ncbi:MAG: aspartate aminotransferase family protein, partial [Acinetobacter sp.]|nr:aspartate aminotransferase family protein [Acinetobacter sp.]
MVDFTEHRKALLCNDAQSIADYESAMGEATKAVAAWLHNDKMYTGGSIKELRSAIAFNPSKEGLGVHKSLERMVELFLNKSLK